MTTSLFADEPSAKGNANKIIIGERAVTEFTFDFIAENKNSDYLLVIRPAKEDMVMPDSTMEYNCLLNLEGDKIGDGYAIYSGESVNAKVMKGVSPNSKLFIDIFSTKEVDNNLVYTYETTSDTIFTLALEPRYQGDNIMFYAKKETSMWVLCRKGSGENRIILMSKATTPVKGSDPKPPKDGTVINPAISGADSTWQDIGNNTWVVYNSYQNPDKQCVLTGLDPATRYWFYCLEYNGLGTATNFKAINGVQNPRLVYTLAAPPIMNPVKEIKDKSFVISWKPMNNIRSYVIDIAYDENFTDKVDIYNELDVELYHELEIELDDPVQPVYYVRVMAYLKGVATPWSETQVVEM